MSTGYDETETDDVTETPDSDQSPAALREAAKRGTKARQEADSLKRENAFLKAGINPDDPRLGYFVRGYDGELKTDVIREAAVAAGFIQADPGQQEQAAVQQQQAGAQERIMQAATGAAVENNSEAAVLAQLERAMNEGGIEAMLDVARQYGVPTTYDGQ